MPVAAIALDFDPVLRLADLAVRLETLVVAAGLLAALLLAALVAGRTPVAGATPSGGRPHRSLRRDDILYLVLAAIPGAVVGGRLGYVLLHLPYYSANPAAALDPGQGSLELSMGVAGAALSAAYLARVLGEPVGRWLHVAAAPALLAIAVGKAGMALGGNGQGRPSAVEWATAYHGPGPWGALVPHVPAHPAQLYEAAAAGLVLLALLVLAAAGAFRRRDGLAWFLGIGGWAAARAAVATTWLDAPVLGPLRAGQLLALGLAGACLLGAIATVRRRAEPTAAREPKPEWLDPATRSRF